MNERLSVLTEKQLKVWNQHQANLSFEEMAELNGVKPPAVKEVLRKASRRLEVYDDFISRREFSKKIIHLEINKVEFDFIKVAITKCVSTEYRIHLHFCYTREPYMRKLCVEFGQDNILSSSLKVENLINSNTDLSENSVLDLELTFAELEDFYSVMRNYSPYRKNMDTHKRKQLQLLKEFIGRLNNVIKTQREEFSELNSFKFQV